jgi:hypothetical protein
MKIMSYPHKFEQCSKHNLLENVCEKKISKALMEKLFTLKRKH